MPKRIYQLPARTDLSSLSREGLESLQLVYESKDNHEGFVRVSFATLLSRWLELNPAGCRANREGA